jgi:hypothetical protein
MIATLSMRRKVGALRRYLSAMKRSIPLLLLPLLFVACSDSGPKDDVADIRACYDNYFAALKAGEGDKAAELVDSNTLAHFDRMLGLARTGDSMTVSGLDPMDKLTVLAMRMQIAPTALKSMDARKAVAHSVSDGLMANEGPEGLELGTVSVDGDKATAPLKMHGFPTPASFSFQREDGTWKIDLTSLFDLTRMAFQQMGGSGPEGNAMLVKLLEENTGTTVPDGIWHPAP